MRDSAIIYRSFYESLKDLPKKNQAEVWAAIMEFSLNFKEIELTGISKVIFCLVKPQLEANITRYKNGAKPKRNRSETEANDKQTISKTEANKNVNVNVNKNDNHNDNKNYNDRSDFDFFWDLYDKKVGDKNKLLKKWNQIPESEHEKIFNHVRKYKNAQPEKQFRKNPETYLDNKSWNDEVVLPGQISKPEKKVTNDNLWG